jgi:lactobin A/cerein 7B family class IIb bacteriocin
MSLLEFKGFEELSNDELLVIDGGTTPWEYIYRAAAAVGGWVSNNAGAVGCFAVGAWGGYALTPSGSPPSAYAYNALVGGLVGAGCYYYGKM